MPVSVQGLAPRDGRMDEGACERGSHHGLASHVHCHLLLQRGSFGEHAIHLAPLALCLLPLACALAVFGAKLQRILGFVVEPIRKCAKKLYIYIYMCKPLLCIIYHTQPYTYIYIYIYMLKFFFTSVFPSAGTKNTH